MNDLRYAIRALGQRPGFSIIAVATLALGIGANTAMFSVVHSVLLRPLPYPRSGELVQVFSTWQGSPSTVSPPDFTDWRSDNAVFSELAAVNAGSVALTGDGPAEQLASATVTGSLFAVLGVAPHTGRTLDTGDDAPGAEGVAVLGHGLWQRRFGGDPAVIGRRIIVDGASLTVVGVMPAGFDFPQGAELWTPLAFSERELSTQRGAHYLDVIGRLRPGVTVDRAAEDMRQIAARLAETYPNTNADGSAVVSRLQDAIVGDVRPALRILLGAVGLVLLIACVNVANLLLVRGAGRRRELAIRTAMGASARRLMRGLLVESIVLALVSGAIGVGLAVWGTAVIAGLQSTGLPRLDQTGINPAVLGFTLVLSLATGVLFGLLPAWQAGRTPDVAGSLKEESGTVSAEAGRGRTRRMLVTAELALAVVLLSGAGLLIRSFVGLARVDLGIVPSGVLTFAVSLPDATYGDPERRVGFTDQLLERLAGLPGVESAGAVFGMPLTGFGYTISTSELDGRRLDDQEQDRLSVQVRAVTPEYFRAMGITLRSGRGLAPQDRAGAPRVIVVNQAAARRLWPETDPIGHQLTVGTGFGLGQGRAGGEVVGVVADVKERGPAAEARPTMFLPLAQWPLQLLSVAIRTSGDPSALVVPARSAVAGLDPDIPVYRVRTLQQLAADAVAQPRLYASLLGLFAIAATLLAAIGVYGVVARTLQQRFREVGIRMALGARPTEVRRLLMRQGMTPVVTGVSLGIVGGVALTRVLQRLLFQVTAWDPVAFAGAAFLLMAVAVIAIYLPARRATMVDPVVVLRHE